jgi:hypothetical protein
MIVLVTGLMRTGTSLISKQLHLMGVPMGTEMRFPPARETGQDDWEDIKFTDLMLNHIMGLDLLDYRAFKSEISAYERRRVREAGGEFPVLWGVKSPFALPHIDTIKEAVDDEVKVVMTTRDLEETYKSIKVQTDLALMKRIQDGLVEFNDTSKADLVIEIEESWSSPESVKLKLEQLIRS